MIAHINLRRQFFANLTLQSILMSFSRLNFSTRKFPPILPFAIAPLGGEKPTITDDDSSNNIDVFTSFHGLHSNQEAR